MTGSNDDRRGSRRKKSARLATLIGLVLVVAASATVVGAGNVTRQTVLPVDVHNTTSFWTRAAKPVATPGRTVAVHAARFRSLTLDTAALSSVLALAPAENTLRAETSPLVVSLPAPNGKFQLFALHESSVMAPGLAARHPGIKTYSGLGLTDQAATIHADLTPLGFHASVRSANGHVVHRPVLRRPRARALRELLRALREEHGRRVRRARARARALRLREAESPEIGEQLRTYRLALITDPGYSDYFGGPPNVTPAKVALMNRVDQVYEDDMSIRLQLIANNDLLNLDTWGQATAPNGPCGAAACFTQSAGHRVLEHDRAQYVIGQIIGASNYDIGHLALGQPGGGVANLGVVGRSNKAGGCTGVPTPVGDLYAIDYVAHEMGHQFAGNHTFNGNQLNCSGGNRNGADLRRAGQRPVDHGLRGHLPHRRRAAAQRRLLLGAEPAGDQRVRLLEPAADQRGADGLAPPLRRRERDAGRDLRAPATRRRPRSRR